MYKIQFLVVIALLMFSCKIKKEKETEEKTPQENIKITTLNYEQLKPILHKNDNKTYVINFWATWCVPCVKELPAFEKLHKEYKDKQVEVILVSLDFSRQIESNLLPFIKEKQLQSTVLHFDDPNEQFWIKDIAENWTGSIPATLIYNAEKRKFYEQTFHYNDLENELQTFLN
ncbi:TlpA disulfide reductase family protein [Tenacibaculum sp. TC6]|uniref:TlpA disulfide reductase family protein n=1 Tax=Tenacibaculum sp. TC6 TaxID=3423223 RepID=UPI003D36638F